MKRSHSCKEKRGEYRKHVECQVKGSEAGELVIKEWKAGRKPGQGLLSHSKDEQTKAWGVEQLV